MTHPLPTEHLSPSQLQAYMGLETGQPIEVSCVSLTVLIEIINLLITKDKITVACNSHTMRLAQDYKSRHSLSVNKSEIESLSVRYKDAMALLQKTYRQSYPIDGAPIHRQYEAVLHSFGLSMEGSFDIHDGLLAIPTQVYNSSDILDNIIPNHKHTWSRYDDIDPLHSIYYTTTDDESLSQYLDMWTHTVYTIYNDMQKGLSAIVETEIHRILSIKKQLKQHLVNYQHRQTESELSQMRQKIGFIMADLPKDSYLEFTDLVMFTISNWESVTSKYLARYRRRFNSRNQQSVVIYEATQELRSVLRDIDTNGNIKLKLSNNALSYETQIAQVKDLIKQLQYCSDWIEDETEYIAWKSYYGGLSQLDKSFVDVLTSLDKSDRQQQLDYLRIQSWKNEVMIKGIPTIDDSLAVFEAHKELSATIDWNHVQLISESINTDYHLSYDGVAYILSNAKPADATSTITIKDNLLSNIKSMVTLDYYGQSQQADELTNAMIATQAKFRTYQTRTLNIISCLDDADTAHMLSLLSDNNINELKGESTTELIKGSILEEGKEKMILVYDDLLNVHQTEQYIWQRLVLQSMSFAGYEVISINAQDSLDHVGLDKNLSPYISSHSTLTVKSNA